MVLILSVTHISGTISALLLLPLAPKCSSLALETTVLFTKIEADTWVYLIDCGLIAPVQMRILAKAKNPQPKGKAPPGSGVRNTISRKGIQNTESNRELEIARVQEMEADIKPDISW